MDLGQCRFPQVSEVCLREALRNEQLGTTRIISDLYSRGGCFEARSGNRINLLKVSVVFLFLQVKFLEVL